MADRAELGFVAKHFGVLFALADVMVLLAIYLAIVLTFAPYTFDLFFDLLNPSSPRVLIWCIALLVIWLVVASNQGAFERTVLRNPFQACYVGAKVTLVAGALFHLLPLVGGPVY